MESEPVSQSGPQKGSKASSGRGRLLLFALAIVALIVISQVVDVQDMLGNAMDKVKDLGWLGYLLFAVLYVAATVLFLAPTVLTFGAGAVYGVAAGTVLVSVSSMLGACTAFLLGRHLAREAIAAKVEGNVKFKAIDDAVRKQGWKIVGLTRLSPVFPFSLLNYMYGLTPVSFRHYFFASWIGMLPGTVMYVYLGTAGESLVTLGAEGRERTTGEWALLAVGLVVTIIVTLFVTRLASKALADAVEPDNGERTD
ncbi:MAG: TVP38/TMEM64 family protein [Candidatus Hydrogenedentes bacterium]|nr:TVP38/TMEM64 family protein [Candidatus Hydrogenedentota bacterium]